MTVKTVIQKVPIGLLLIPAIFVLHNANYYFRLLNWRYIWPSLAIFFAAGIILFLLCYPLFRSKIKAALFSYYLLFIFYFFQSFHDLLRGSGTKPLASYSLILPLLTGTIVLVFYLLKRRRSCDNLFYTCNIILLLFTAAGLIEWSYYRLIHHEKNHHLADPDKPLARSFQYGKATIKPDIYFIIFDTYTNSSTLASQFLYDNSFIENYLKQRGFYIPSRSKSNYNITNMSVASELNMNYLQRLNTKKTFYSKEVLQADFTTRHNELVEILTKEGYRIKNYSLFNLEGHPTEITAIGEEIFHRSVAGQTFFNKLNRDIGWHFAKYKQQNKILEKKLARIEKDVTRIRETQQSLISETQASDIQPKFVYAHFLLPHETFYFDTLGNRLDPEYTASLFTSPKDYVNQITYANKFLILPFVDSLFKNATRPFVVIIQGDHGYRNYGLNSPLEFNNFSAIYFHDRQYPMLHDSVTTVNTFRFVLNKYFHQQLPVLRDTSINLSKHRTR